MLAAKGNKRRNLAEKRLVIVALPAAIMTFGLFTAMQTLIDRDSIDASHLTVYDLAAFMPGEESPVQDSTQIMKPVKPEALQPPPQPQKLAKAVSNPKVPYGGYTGAAPADYGPADDHKFTPVQTGMMIVRYMQPLTPPAPVYPDAAVRRGLSGHCDVSLNVSPKGDPFDVRASCTDQVFEKPAENAVQKVKFAPKIHRGTAQTVTGVVYPIEFRLEP